MKKTLITIIITFVVTSLLWVASLFIWFFPRINELEEALLLEKVKRKEIGSAIKREANSSSKRTRQYEKQHKQIKSQNGQIQEQINDLRQKKSHDIDYDGDGAPSTDYSEKELYLTVHVYDSTGSEFRIGTINPRGTLLDLETDGKFVLTNSDNQQYKYMTTEQLRGKGKLYVIKLK